MKLAITRALAPFRVRRTRWLAAGSAAVVCSALAGWHVGGRVHGGAGDAHATLAKIVHGGAEPGTGVVAVGKDGHRAELAEGARIAWGTRLETSPGTRARLELDDGTAVALDRATSVWLDARADDAAPGRRASSPTSRTGSTLLVSTALGEVRAADARFAMTADDARASVEVARGDVDVKGARDQATVHAGEEGDLTRDAGRVEITATTDLAQRVAFGEGFDAKADDDAPPAGLGRAPRAQAGEQGRDRGRGAPRAARRHGAHRRRDGAHRGRRDVRQHDGPGARGRVALPAAAGRAPRAAGPRGGRQARGGRVRGREPRVGDLARGHPARRADGAAGPSRRSCGCRGPGAIRRCSSGSAAGGRSSRSSPSRGAARGASCSRTRSTWRPRPACAATSTRSRPAAAPRRSTRRASTCRCSGRTPPSTCARAGTISRRGIRRRRRAVRASG